MLIYKEYWGKIYKKKKGDILIYKENTIHLGSVYIEKYWRKLKKGQYFLYIREYSLGKIQKKLYRQKSVIFTIGKTLYRKRKSVLCPYI